MDAKPPGHADFANLIRSLWTSRELGQVAEELEELERRPGFARLMALLDSRERLIVDRLVVGEPGEIRVTDQLLGMCAGLRQGSRAIASIRYEANQARERAAEAARVADSRGDSS